jgi:hypothetical protein
MLLHRHSGSLLTQERDALLLSWTLYHREGDEYVALSVPRPRF